MRHVHASVRTMPPRRAFTSTRPSCLRIANRPGPAPLSRNIPQVDFTGSVMHVTNQIGYMVKTVLKTGLILGGVGLLGVAGVHGYVEWFKLSIPSRGEDEYGWEYEVQGWTGGERGGTDPRLGWRARVAIRGAWIAQNWRTSDPVVSQREGIFTPDYWALKGMIGVDPDSAQPDKGFVLSNAYLNAALDIAKKQDLAFPPTLSVLRRSGPPMTTATTQADPTVVDLLLLKAGALERIGTREALVEAKEVYERVIAGIPPGSITQQAKLMRLAGKTGSLCERMGEKEEALAWWGWGLDKVGLTLPSRVQEVKTEVRSWFGKTPKVEQQKEREQILPSLPPPMLRAAVTLLTTAATHLAMHGHFAAASSAQSTALALLPAPTPLPRPDHDMARLVLHHTWLSQRAALLTLHLASTTYAQGRPALGLANIADTRAEHVLKAIDPVPSVYTGALYPPAQHLRRDALLTAAEASFTRALLLEKDPSANLETIAEMYERSMSLNAQESGKEGEMGAEWDKYYSNFARVRAKLGSVE